MVLVRMKIVIDIHIYIYIYKVMDNLDWIVNSNLYVKLILSFY